jgi:hypothetical protein
LDRRDFSNAAKTLAMIVAICAPASLADLPPVATMPSTRSPVMAPPGPRVVINEIHPAPPPGETEYVELYNAGDEAAVLAELRLADARRSPGKPNESGPLTLEPGSYLVLAADPASLPVRYGDVRTIEIGPWPALNNGGDLVLVAYAGEPVDSVEYNGAALTPGVSLERINPRAPAELVANWAAATSPDGGTPGRVNSVFVVDASPPELLVAEYVDNRTLEIRFSEPLDPATLDLTAVRVDGTPLSGASLVPEGDAMSGNAPAEGVRVFVPEVSDYSGNLGGPFEVDTAHRPKPGELAVTELHFAPARDAFGVDGPEFVEVSNLAPHPLSLAGITLEIGPPGDPDSVVPLRRPGRALAPRSSAVVYSEPDSERRRSPQSGSALLDAHPGASSNEFLPVPVAGTGLGLNNSGDSVRLRDATVDSETLETFTYSADWHDNRYRRTTGRSLERIVGSGSSGQPIPLDPLGASTSLAWRTPNEPSPGRYEPLHIHPIAAPGEVVLSEILYDPIADPDDARADQVEFLELANVSAKTVDLNGLMLLSGPADRELSDSLRIIWGPTPLSPGAAAVVYNAPDRVADDDVDTFLRAAFPGAASETTGPLQALRKSLGLSADGERLRIQGPGGVILDELTYRPDWHHFLVLDGSGSSIERIDLSLAADDANNWTTSTDPSGGTPGFASASAAPPRPEAPGSRLQILPETFSPNGDGIDDIVRIAIDSGGGRSAVRVLIFDVEGRLVKRLPVAPAGSAAHFWAGDDDGGRAAPSGVYIVLAETFGPGSGGRRSSKAAVAIVR